MIRETKEDFQKRAGSKPRSKESRNFLNEKGREKHSSKWKEYMEWLHG